MAENSKISWTHHTFNPWWGCVKVSPACVHCYAETFAKRVGQDVWGPTARRRFFGPKHWDEPFKWDRAAERAGERHRVFCASMADVFEVLPDGHPDRAELEIERGNLFALVRSTPNLDWLILTKRPDVMATYFAEREVPANVVAMTTVENQEWAGIRIPHLLRVPAKRRGLSIEPLLGPVDLSKWIAPRDAWQSGHLRCCSLSYPEIRSNIFAGGCRCLHWVIVGGESGSGARPMHPGWARSLRDQCIAAGVAFHFKQWGNYAPAYSDDVLSPKGIPYGIGDDPDGSTVFALPDGTLTNTDWNGGPGPQLKGATPMIRIGKKIAGRILDGRTWDEVPA